VTDPEEATMAIRKVARMGHPVLTRKAEPLDPRALGEPRIQRLIDDMIETMYDEHGVGLAAPQVHESVRLFVMDPGPSGEGEPGLRVLVNPVLTFPGEERFQLWEGCLSIPGIRGLTERRTEVQVACLDREGKPHRLAFHEFPAAVVQHETDHLDGILFLKRMPDLAALAFESEFSRFRLAGPEEDDEDDGAEM